jgi:hypothetical protein
MQGTKSDANVADETIDTFCKSVYNLRSINTRTFQQERSEPAQECFMNAVEDPYVDPVQVNHIYTCI